MFSKNPPSHASVARRPFASRSPTVRSVATAVSLGGLFLRGTRSPSRNRPAVVDTGAGRIPDCRWSYCVSAISLSIKSRVFHVLCLKQQFLQTGQLILLGLQAQPGIGVLGGQVGPRFHSGGSRGQSLPATRRKSVQPGGGDAQCQTRPSACRFAGSTGPRRLHSRPRRRRARGWFHNPGQTPWRRA